MRIDAAFEQAWHILRRRIEAFCCSSVSPEERLQAELNRIGETIF
jgi:arsenate reductase